MSAGYWLQLVCTAADRGGTREGQQGKVQEYSYRPLQEGGRTGKDGLHKTRWSKRREHLMSVTPRVPGPQPVSAAPPVMAEGGAGGLGARLGQAGARHPTPAERRQGMLETSLQAVKRCQVRERVKPVGLMLAGALRGPAGAGH